MECAIIVGSHAIGNGPLTHHFQEILQFNFNLTGTNIFGVILHFPSMRRINVVIDSKMYLREALPNECLMLAHVQGKVVN